MAAAINKEDSWSTFLKIKEKIERLLFWVERSPMILMPMWFVLSPANLSYGSYPLSKCITLFLLTTCIYMILSLPQQFDDIIKSAASYRNQKLVVHKTTLVKKKDVELSGFALERIGVACLYFSTLDEQNSFVCTVIATLFFTITNLLYLQQSIDAIMDAIGELVSDEQRVLDSIEETIKLMKEFEEDRDNWEKKWKQILEDLKSAMGGSEEDLKNVIKTFEDDLIRWEKKKNDLITKLSSANASNSALQKTFHQKMMKTLQKQPS